DVEAVDLLQQVNVPDAGVGIGVLAGDAQVGDVAGGQAEGVGVGGEGAAGHVERGGAGGAGQEAGGGGRRDEGRGGGGREGAVFQRLDERAGRRAVALAAGPAQVRAGRPTGARSPREVPVAEHSLPLFENDA